jgi:hypothetical protein
MSQEIIMSGFSDRTIDSPAPHRCGSCIYFEHRKVFDKPCKDLGVADRDKICTKFIVNTIKWTPLQRQAMLNLIRTMRAVGLLPRDLQALMYNVEAKGDFGRHVYIKYGDNKVSQAVVLRTIKDRSVVMLYDVGTIAIIDASMIKDASEMPEITTINTDAFSAAPQEAPAQPGKRGRRKKGSEPAVPDKAILQSIKDSLEDSLSPSSGQDEPDGDSHAFAEEEIDD